MEEIKTLYNSKLEIFKSMLNENRYSYGSGDSLSMQRNFLSKEEHLLIYNWLDDDNAKRRLSLYTVEVSAGKLCFN